MRIDRLNSKQIIFKFKFIKSVKSMCDLLASKLVPYLERLLPLFKERKLAEEA